MTHNGGKLTWRGVQQAFNRRGIRLSKKNAQMVIVQLPKASVATGWSESRMLQIVIEGAPDTLKRLRVL